MNNAHRKTSSFKIVSRWCVYIKIDMIQISRWKLEQYSRVAVKRQLWNKPQRLMSIRAADAFYSLGQQRSLLCDRK